MTQHSRPDLTPREREQRIHCQAEAATETRD